MSYYSGTASSLSDLRTALLTHAQADGWTLTGDVLSKAGVYFQIQVTADHVTCLGCESNAAANPAPSAVRIGKMWSFSGRTTRLISFPCNYEVFGFAQELYLIVNYDVDRYQWLAFGKSTVPGLVGQGGWCGATVGGAPGTQLTFYNRDLVLHITPTEGGTDAYSTTPCGALFWQTAGAGLGPRNAWVNHGLDSHGWTWNGAANSLPIGIRHQPLIALQPNAWNSEAVLLPIRAYKERPSFKASLVADLANARHVRIDNIAPGDILTIGSDEWRVFPWYMKNVTYRNGTTDTPTGDTDHSGTFGWAIRYEGP